MKISIVTPTRSIDQFLIESINSVRSQQTSFPIEHIIVLDGPSPLPPSISSPSYNLFFIRNRKSAGPSGARNTALDIATGSLLAFLDADDVWEPNYLDTMVSQYIRDPQLDATSTLGYKMVTSGLLTTPAAPVTRDDFLAPSAICWNAIGCPSGFSYRLSNFRQIRFNEQMRYLEDYLFYLSLLDAGMRKVWHSNAVIFHYRISSGQATHAPLAHSVDRSLAVFEDALSRLLTQFPKRYRIIARAQARRLCSRLARRPTALWTIALAMMAPSWAAAQLRRLTLKRPS